MVDHLALTTLLDVLLGLQVTPADLGRARLIEMTGRPSAFSGTMTTAETWSPRCERWLARARLNLAGRDDGFHLAADVDQDLVPVDEHDSPRRPARHVAAGCAATLFVLFEQRAHTHVLGTCCRPQGRWPAVLSPRGCSGAAPRGVGCPRLFRSTTTANIRARTSARVYGTLAVLRRARLSSRHVTDRSALIGDFSSARATVTSSAYSRSPPTGRPRARRVTWTPSGRQATLEIAGGGVALDVRIGRQDDLAHRSPSWTRRTSSSIFRSSTVTPCSGSSAPCRTWYRPL